MILFIVNTYEYIKNAFKRTIYESFLVEAKEIESSTVWLQAKLAKALVHAPPLI